MIANVANEGIMLQSPEESASREHEEYDKMPRSQRRFIVFLVSWCGFLSPLSSTAVLSAIPEVSETYNTTADMVGVSNALYLIFMGLSPLFWGPLNRVYGRRWTSITASILFTLSSVATALAPNFASFFAFRILMAFTGTSFLVTGPAVVGDLYHPVERATVMSYFAAGTLIGPAFGPLIGGIIVTHTSWRAIFWVQVALAGLGAIGVTVFLPETLAKPGSHDLKGLPKRQKIEAIWTMGNPVRVLEMAVYPNLTVAALANGANVWNMYGILTPIRYVLNPRFNLTSPTQSALFFLAPGLGYLVGTIFGGQWSDYTTKKWIRKRNGTRIPEDRLRSCILFLGVAMPTSTLVYGWTVQKHVGGISVPIVAMFLGGVAQLFCNPSINTYCLDVMPDRGAESLAWNFFVRYMFGAVASAVVIPAITTIGVGWFSTISAVLLLISALLVSIVEMCFTAACSYVGEFITDHGRWFTYGMRDGCHGGQGVPGLETICIDYRQARAHFKFSHQSNKRCMRGDWTRDDCGVNACGTWWFHETPCTWREALEIDEDGISNQTEEFESVSALPEPTPEAVRFKA
ncbi:major facilitator superfamily protein [Sarocladium implicatum]|nr:major facilitator superfamily protein [Sarocladium implicatum]